MFLPFRAMLRDPESKVLALAAVAVIALGSVAYMLIEHWTPVQAVYFCVVTLATVGYGDLHPTTEVGQLFTVFYIVSGLGIIAAFITELAKHRPRAARLGAEIARAEGGGLLGAGQLAGTPPADDPEADADLGADSDADADADAR